MLGAGRGRPTSSSVLESNPKSPRQKLEHEFQRQVACVQVLPLTSSVTLIKVLDLSGPLKLHL